MRSAISIVQVPELKTRTGRPPQSAESCPSKAFTCGPDVSQPERSTSATPAIVSSSISGRVIGRYGRGAGEAGAAGTAVGAGMLGFVAEQIKVPGLHGQMIMERG